MLWRCERSRPALRRRCGLERGEALAPPDVWHVETATRTCSDRGCGDGSTAIPMPGRKWRRRQPRREHLVRPACRDRRDHRRPAGQRRAFREAMRPPRPGGDWSPTSSLEHRGAMSAPRLHVVQNLRGLQPGPPGRRVLGNGADRSTRVALQLLKGHGAAYRRRPTEGSSAPCWGEEVVTHAVERRSRRGIR